MDDKEGQDGDGSPQQLSACPAKYFLFVLKFVIILVSAFVSAFAPVFVSVFVSVFVFMHVRILIRKDKMVMDDLNDYQRSLFVGAILHIMLITLLIHCKVYIFNCIYICICIHRHHPTYYAHYTTLNVQCKLYIMYLLSFALNEN